MSNVTNKLFVDKMGGRNAEQYVGVQGELFYDPADGRIRLSDGVTAGGTLVNTPTSAIPYRGFYAAYGSFFGDDPSVNQIIISKNPGMKVSYDTADTDNDDMHATGLSGSDMVVVLNLYGNNTTEGLKAPAVARFVKKFIDDILFGQNNVQSLKENFYNNIDAVVNATIPNTLYQNFNFFSNANWEGQVTLPLGQNATLPAVLNIYADSGNNNQYAMNGVANGGSGYQVNDQFMIPGTAFGLESPQNDVAVLVTQVGDNGAVVMAEVNGTGIAGGWSNFISDGGDDQYDGGNFLNTNLATEISYGNGVAQWDNAAVGGNYVVTYQNSVFGMFINGNISEFYFSGNMGADGNGDKVESALFGHESAQNTEAVDSFGNLIVADSSEVLVDVGPGETHQVPNMSGLILVNDHYDGGVEMWLVGSGNGTEKLVMSTRTQTGTVQADYSVNGYSWTNTSNLNGPFTFTVVKTRNGA